MSLIWSAEFNEDVSLATRVAELAQAEGKAVEAEAGTLPDAEASAALLARAQAQQRYAAAVTAAEAALTGAMQGGKSYTHVIVIGVGRYSLAGVTLPPLTTSIHGARAFIEWLLTEFENPDRPLGSVELLLSPTLEMGDWKPSEKAAVKLGLTVGETLPVEEATFSRTDAAFERCLRRARAKTENALVFYFSGHGLWKVSAYLMPEDARIASAAQSFENLIDITATHTNMVNTGPSLQAFFVDACQELPPALLQTLDMVPGTPLYKPFNTPAVDRDARMYFGSRAGKKAYGPEDAPPFFTQSLLACLRRRGARHRVGGKWWVFTESLRVALEKAARSLPPADGKKIEFSFKEDGSRMERLCCLTEKPEVFAEITCRPSVAQTSARLYMEAVGQERIPGPNPSLEPWYTVVAHGAWKAGAEFNAPAQFTANAEEFDALPPFVPIEITCNAIVPAGGGNP